MHIPTHQPLSKQRGWSAFTIIFALFTATFLAKVGYVVGPAYYDNYLVQNGLKDLAERFDQERLQRIRKSEANAELNKFYTLNGVRNPDIVNALDIERTKESTFIKVDYEVRSSFWGNVDVVMSFQNHLDSAKPQECCAASE